MYFLMNKDNAIAEFTLPESNLEQAEFHAYEGARLPIGFAGITEWIEDRKASKHNEHLRKVMADCGCDRTEGFIKVTHSASINDTFWIKSDSEDVSWKDVSFYTNSFNETVSRLAFEGLGLYGIRLSSTSPELVTGGSFRKCWRREENGIYLYKAGRKGAVNLGREPYCEMLASKIACCISKNAVDYSLARIHGEPATKCRLFTDEKYGYASIHQAGIHSSEVRPFLDFYSKIGEEETFREMMVTDALTFNTDRHSGNFGVLFDNDSLEMIRMAPIFDMNMALLPCEMKGDYENIGHTLRQYHPCIGNDFTRVGQELLTPSIRASLINLKGFEFDFRGDEMFPEWRVRATEEIINRQIDALLNRTVMYVTDVFPDETHEECHADEPIYEDELTDNDLSRKC